MCVHLREGMHLYYKFKKKYIALIKVNLYGDGMTWKTKEKGALKL